MKRKNRQRKMKMPSLRQQSTNESDIHRQKSHKSNRHNSMMLNLGHKQVDLGYYMKDTVHNKHINKYRDVMTHDDSGILPFLCSLRTKKSKGSKSTYTGKTCVEAFEVAHKDTLNQKIKKQVGDIIGSECRKSNANYRWHNKSGRNIKQCCQFQCLLRYNNEGSNPEENKFINVVKPIQTRKVEEYKYSRKQIICDRQNKVFALID